MITKTRNPKNHLKDLNFEYIEGFVEEDKLKLFFDLFESGPLDPRGYVPFYWVPYTTSYKFPQFSHTLLGRNDPNPRSYLYEYFKDIIISFLDDNNLKYKSILRSCLNLTYHIPNCNFTDPHIDQNVNHYVIILYLDNCKGNTIIFNQEYDYETKFMPISLDYDSIDVEKFTIKTEINPQRGKILCFNGKHYHALRLPHPGELRKICIFNVEF